MLAWTDSDNCLWDSAMWTCTPSCYIWTAACHIIKNKSNVKTETLKDTRNKHTQEKNADLISWCEVFPNRDCKKPDIERTTERKWKIN